VFFSFQVSISQKVDLYKLWLFSREGQERTNQWYTSQKLKFRHETRIMHLLFHSNWNNLKVWLVSLFSNICLETFHLWFACHQYFIKKLETKTLLYFWQQSCRGVFWILSALRRGRLCLGNLSDFAAVWFWLHRKSIAP